MRTVERLRRRLCTPLALRNPRYAALFPATASMPVLKYPVTGDPGQAIVFLPGIRDVPEDFFVHGLIEAAQAHGLGELAAADAHLGYYLRGCFVERLREDVIHPILRGSDKRLWLVGVSLGGFGATLYAQHYPEDLAGMVLLAPFLGNAPIIGEISQAGGLADWNPMETTEADHERQLWLWLKKYCAAPRDLPRLYLGYGQSDEFAPANRLLAEALPEEWTLAVPGGHDWQTWRRLWEDFLTRNLAEG